MTANLVELGLEEFAENEFVFKAVTEVQVFFLIIKIALVIDTKTQKIYDLVLKKLDLNLFLNVLFI